MSGDHTILPKSRNYLVEALRAEAFTYLSGKGFVQLKMASEELVDFNRISGQKVQCLTFQFDKYGLARFKVSIAEGPLEGLAQYGGEFVPGRALRTYHCRGEKAILTSCNKRLPFVRLGFLGWFSMRLAIMIGQERAALRPVLRFVTLFQECENWWKSKTYGPHLFRDEISEQLESILEKKHGNLN
jgi:hypothetical protein